jgi:hypothetical protein
MLAIGKPALCSVPLESYHFCAMKKEIKDCIMCSPVDLGYRVASQLIVFAIFVENVSFGEVPDIYILSP